MIKGMIKYKGYKIHDVDLQNSEQWLNLLEVLRQQGALYFYPSKIDDVEAHLMIYGLLYVIERGKASFYHFGELTVTFSKNNKLPENEFKLILYPYILNTPDIN